MPKIDIFFDSSALIAGIISSQGAARALLLLAENEEIKITISEQVITEVERNLARKAPNTIVSARGMILASRIRIVHDPSKSAVFELQDWIKHPADVPILVAAVNAKSDFLVTLNTRHFINDPGAAQKSGLRIGTPGDALAWIRNQFQ